ncbi:MAG: hypothetical protein OET79_16555, partial [Nitrospirota bacterium]|nr:hypothetical protein [Nitrospirota bacterium]
MRKTSRAANTEGLGESQVTTVEQLAARVADQASVALAPDYSGCAIAVIHALIRRGVSGLRLIGVPQLGF